MNMSLNCVYAENIDHGTKLCPACGRFMAIDKNRQLFKHLRLRIVEGRFNSKTAVNEICSGSELSYTSEEHENILTERRIYEEVVELFK